MHNIPVIREHDVELYTKIGDCKRRYSMKIDKQL